MAHGEVELDVHDAHTFELAHAVVQKLTHAANLAVEALGQDDRKGMAARLLDDTFACTGSYNRNAVAHLLNEFFGDWLIHRYQIFFFVVVARTQNFIDDIAVVGQENEPLAGFV